MPPETENNDTETKNRGGRPKGSTKLKPDDETFKNINGLARIQCTQREAAAVLGVEERTFHSFLQLHKKARDAWEEGRDQGRASLRRMQYKAAEGGNVTMQIWLGKQLLDQRDKSDGIVSGRDGGPVVFEIVTGVPQNDDADTPQD